MAQFAMIEYEGAKKPVDARSEAKTEEPFEGFDDGWQLHLRQEVVAEGLQEAFAEVRWAAEEDEQEGTSEDGGEGEVVEEAEGKKRLRAECARPRRSTRSHIGGSGMEGWRYRRMVS